MHSALLRAPVPTTTELQMVSSLTVNNVADEELDTDSKKEPTARQKANAVDTFLNRFRDKYEGAVLREFPHASLVQAGCNREGLSVLLKQSNCTRRFLRLGFTGRQHDAIRPSCSAGC